MSSPDCFSGGVDPYHTTKADFLDLTFSKNVPKHIAVNSDESSEFSLRD